MIFFSGVSHSTFQNAGWISGEALIFVSGARGVSRSFPEEGIGVFPGFGPFSWEGSGSPKWDGRNRAGDRGRIPCSRPAGAETRSGEVVATGQEVARN